MTAENEWYIDIRLTVEEYHTGFTHKGAQIQSAKVLKTNLDGESLDWIGYNAYPEDLELVTEALLVHQEEETP